MSNSEIFEGDKKLKINPKFMAVASFSFLILMVVYKMYFKEDRKNSFVENYDIVPCVLDSINDYEYNNVVFFHYLYKGVSYNAADYYSKELKGMRDDLLHKKNFPFEVIVLRNNPENALLNTESNYTALTTKNIFIDTSVPKKIPVITP